jgi:hypothetical protein
MSLGPDPEPPPVKVYRVISYVAATLTHAPVTRKPPEYTAYNDAELPSPADLTGQYYDPGDKPTHPNTNTTSCIEPDALVQHLLSPPPSSRQVATICLLQHAMITTIPLKQTLRLHIDGGANRLVTNDKEQLIKYKNIKVYHMSSAGGHNDITCTGVGYITWCSPDGHTVLIKFYYSPDAPETIVSPSDIILSHYSTYHSWMQHANMSSNTGYISFLNNDTGDVTEFHLINNNNMWNFVNDDMNDYQPTTEPGSRPAIKFVDRTTMSVWVTQGNG